MIRAGTATDAQSRRKEYRPDIDGLRALAVVLVVAYHVGVHRFSNGYVGVDVFFVVSGYLITGLLWKELTNEGRIRWTDFYARRARRLFPALTAVLLVTLALGVVLLLPWELSYLARSTMAAAGFVSNIFIWRTTGGYFGVSDKAAPLVHTWSLAVEEQFYVVWPPTLLAISLLARRTRRPRLLAAAIVGVIGVLSLGLAVVASHRAQQADFLFMPTRVWQLAAGAVLALLAPDTSRLPRVTGEIAAALGLVLIASCLVLAPTTDFPSVPALAAVVGTGLVIAGQQRQGGRVGRALSFRPLVLIGLLSYGWYLWHWPLLTLARVTTGHDSVGRDALIALAALVPAAASYRWIEQPIRSLRRPSWRTPRRALLLGGGALVATAILASAVSTTSDSILIRTAPGVPVRSLLDAKHSSWPCLKGPMGGPVPHDACRTISSGGAELVLVGDSHAGAFVAGGEEVARRLGLSFATAWRPSCPLIRGFEDLVEHGCVDHDARELRALADPSRHVAAVLWVARYAAYTATTEGARAPFFTGYPVALGGAESRSGAPPAQLAAAAASTIREVTASGIPVIVLLPTPELSQPAPECLGRHSPSACGVDRARAEQARDRVVRPLLDALRNDPLVSVWDPFTPLCGARPTCAVVAAGRVLFRDDNHLSADGARYLGRRLTPLVAQVLAANT